jgi:glycosyltransferase involved in cell wall biosynthesis
MISESQQIAPLPSGNDASTALKYVLITPARNEAAFLEETIKAVVNQTQLPVKWVIVSDGSTDGTDDIVNRYAAAHDWIELVRMPERRERHFAGKVGAINAGRERVADLDYDIIGNLDADITIDEDYFRFLLSKFVENPKLGVAGTPFREGTRQYDYRFTSVEHVSGACQLFRKACFADIGGYRAIKTGGIDTIAVITARMKGWETRSFLEKGLHASPRDGHRHARRMDVRIQNRHAGLHAWNRSRLDDFPLHVPDDASAVFDLRHDLPLRLFLGDGQPKRSGSVRRIYPVPKTRTPAPPA